MNLSAEIYLVRHGETAWNTEGRFQGQLDSPLTQKGVGQANAVGRQLAKTLQTASACAFHISPLGRARQTADIFRSFYTYPNSRWDARLQEVTLGSWDGLTHEDIDAGWPGILDGSSSFDWFFRAPDGESYDRAVTRVGDWLSEADGITIAVSHGLIGRLIRGVYLDLPSAEALSLPVPQDVIWHLHDCVIDAIEVRSSDLTSVNRFDPEGFTGSRIK
jgi:broad specificity phosphatase PhoE